MRILCLAVLAIASLAHAQEAPSHFLIEYELTAGVDITHLTQPQMDVFKQHRAQFVKIPDEGGVIAGGHTDNVQHIRPFVIVKTPDAATPRAGATADASPKCSLLPPSA